MHRESVVLLKNQDHTLPLTSDKLSGAKIYAEAFAKEAEKGRGCPPRPCARCWPTTTSPTIPPRPTTPS